MLDNPSAAAPFNVLAEITSSGVILIWAQAIVIIIGMEKLMHEPGLKSLANATGTPASMSFRAGAYPCPRKKETPGRSVAITFASFNASIPLSLTRSR
jgi:hypothetical protein